jgi:anthranilate phosphoribosyltransferase
LAPKVPAEKITDLSGTGGGQIKTINVSTAASLVVAGAGYTVAKQAMFGITSPTGSADVFGAFGIDVFKLKASRVNRTLEKIGICPLFITAMSPKLKNRSDLAKKVFGQIHVKTAFNLVSFINASIPMKKRLYGCYSPKYLPVLAELFSKLGYERTLIVHGVDGLPEVSNVGKTMVVEQEKEKIKQYALVPQDFGLKKARVGEIRTGGGERNITDFLRVIYGKERGAKRDIVLANASASFYILGKVKSFDRGTKLAEQVVDEGLAFKKLEELIGSLGDKQRLEFWKKKAGLVE